MQKEVQAPHLASYIVSSILEVGRVDNRLNVMLPKVIMKKPGNANDIVRMVVVVVVVVVVVIMILVTMTITSRC